MIDATRGASVRYQYPKFSVTAKSGLIVIAFLIVMTACTKSAEPEPKKNTPVTTSSPLQNRAIDIVQDDQRLRGTMINSNVSADDLRVLGLQWHANHVRWQLNWAQWNDPNYNSPDLNKYDAWLEKALNHLDELIPVCKEAGLKVLIDLHTSPGGRNAKNENLLFKDKKYQDKFIEVWTKIAQRYKSNKDVIWGYDLANEPNDTKTCKGLMSWQTLGRKAAQTVRAIDPSHVIIFETVGGNVAFLQSQVPIPVDGIIYSVHMYLPYEVTHQGVLPGKPIGVVYPGIIKDVMWDKDQLRRSLQPVIDFQKKYNVPIYIGEFSAVRWAPDNSAYKYLKDVIDIFEENGWNWAYHAFREWQGWSVELSEDPNNLKPTPSPNQRQMLLRLWFEKNIKNNW